MDKNVSVYCIGLDWETEIIRLTDKGKQWHVLCVRSYKQVESIGGLGSGLIISPSRFKKNIFSNNDFKIDFLIWSGAVSSFGFWNSRLVMCLFLTLAS